MLMFLTHFGLKIIPSDIVKLPLMSFYGILKIFMIMEVFFYENNN
jgi:hypothetical protein